MASVPFNNLITFSRGSNATLTGPTGLVQWAPNNLLLNSEQFDAAIWNKAGATISANTVSAPDGTTTGDGLIEDGTTGLHLAQQFFTFTSGLPYTFSVRVRAGTRAWVQLLLPSAAFGTSQGGYFSLSGAGSLGTITGTPARTITALAGGWYLLTVTATATASAGGNIAIVAASADATNSYAGVNGTTALSLWGAQLELGSAATTYNSTTVKNLLGFSEAFDNAAWTKSNASIVTGAQANPVNGAFNAQKLMENTAAGTHYALQSASVLAAPYALSVYAKAGERSFISLAFDGLNAWFNLSTGALGTVEAGLTASIVSVGSGWYRCSVFRTVAVAGSKSCVVYPASANGVVSYTGDGNSGIYIYGAQLSDSASLDPYVPTPAAAPSSTAYYGPRFDYDPVTLAPKGLLVEEARTNLALRSEEFDNAAWQKQAGVSVTGVNVGVSPSGTTTADEVTFTATTNDSIYQSITVLATTAYTFSVWVKGSGGQVLQVSCQPPAAGAVFTSVTLNGQWQRVTATATTIGAGAMNVAVDLVSGTTPAIVQLWGGQVEAGAFATSYIPTVASTVTRSADVATINGSLFSQWFSNTEGTLLANFVPTLTIANSTRGATITDGTNRVTDIYIDVSVWRSFNGTTNVTPASSTAVLNSTVNFASAYRSGDYAASMNGGAVGTAATVGVQPANKLTIGTNITNSAGFLNGHIRSIDYIPARAADFQLQALTL